MDNFIDLFSGRCISGAIIGDGGIVFNCTTSFYQDYSELKQIPLIFERDGDIMCHGIKYHRENFVIIDIDDNISRAEGVDKGIIISKIENHLCFVIGVYDKKTGYNKCLKTVKDISTHLRCIPDLSSLV